MIAQKRDAAATERLLGSLSLSTTRNPRHAARMFAQAGGERGNLGIETFSHRCTLRTTPPMRQNAIPRGLVAEMLV